MLNVSMIPQRKDTQNIDTIHSFAIVLWALQDVFFLSEGVVAFTGYNLYPPISLDITYIPQYQLIRRVFYNLSMESTSMGITYILKYYKGLEGGRE
jgi:hypothetical protein